ncbi:hypothetical protein ACP70R_008430 [Stipagrostis hirtigluma subsp. patula]
MDAAEARRRSSACSSPEFQFWPLDANPAASPSCADELFAGGVLLPLPVLPPRPRDASGHGAATTRGPELEPETETGDASVAATVAPPQLSAAITSPAPPAGAGGGGGSKRWTDIFSKKPAEEKEREKEKRKDGAGGGRKPAAHAGVGGAGGSGGGSELNINIWPFSRSRSAGGGGGSGSSKPRPPPRKASSAPCSRSNSRGEAAGAAAAAPSPRRWAASPGRAGGGVPVGRSSPVWQIRRPAAKPAPPSSEPFADRRGPSPQKDKPAGGRKPGGLGGGVRGLNLSVNSCIGYRHQVSCRRADAGAVRVPGHAGGGGLFGIKGFFSKKPVH